MGWKMGRLTGKKIEFSHVPKGLCGVFEDETKGFVTRHVLMHSKLIGFRVILVMKILCGEDIRAL